MGKRDAALAWAARGFRVFPIKADAKKPPLVEPFYEKASGDPEQIKLWWTDLYGNELDHNIGVSTTGFVVVDLDNKPGKNGVEAYQKLGGDFGTLIVRTPSGGFHCYYNGGDYGNTQGDKGGIAPGIDTRSRHGYVLGPGSSIDGHSYDVVRDQPVRSIGGEVAERLLAIDRARAERRVAGSDVDADTAWVFAQQYLLDRAPLAIEGAGGDETTYRVACAVRDFGVSEDVAFDLLLEHWNEKCEPPWQPDELKVKVENAYRYGQNSGAVRHPAQSFNGVKIPPLEEATPPEPIVVQGAFGNLIAEPQLAKRPWIFQGLMLRQDVTALIAPGGVGKTQLTLYVAIMLALGRDVLRYENRVGRKRSIVYDEEESLAELSMRLHAQCHLLKLDANDVAPYIRLVSGRDHGRYKVARGGQRGPVAVEKEVVTALVQAAEKDDVAMLSLNPLVSLHEAPENDNTAMRAVLDILKDIAGAANVGVFVSHHTGKGAGQGSDNYVANADAGRGASAVVDATRVSLTLMGPTSKDREEYGLSADEAQDYLRVDDAKANKSRASTRASWLRKEGIRLLSGEVVGAFAPVDLHSRAEAIRIQIGNVMAQGCREKDRSIMSVQQAAEYLKNNWPLFAGMDIRQVKGHVERTLRSPVVFDDGSELVIGLSDAGTRSVILR